jgi:hypothetical protein
MIAGLAVVDVFLFTLWLQAGSPSREPPDSRRSAESGISSVLDSAFARYGIPSGDRRKWKPPSGGSPIRRIAERVLVGPDFPSVTFNQDLSQRLLPYGAHVVATERARESTVTYHIVRRGVTLRSISCVVRANR